MYVFIIAVTQCVTRKSSQSRLPRGTMPLSPSEAAVVTEALQGEWTIKAVNLEPAAQRNNAYVTPIGFESASVTGLTYVMGGGTHGRSLQQSFKLSKLPATGQIYLDTFGTTCVTEGWPHNRPMAGRVGEIMDFKTVFASIRWTRSAGTSTTTGFGATQAAVDMPAVHAVLDGDAARAAAEIAVLQAQIAALAAGNAAAWAPPPARPASAGYGHVYGAPVNPHGAPTCPPPPPPQMPQSLPVQPLYPPMPPVPSSMYPDMPPPAYEVARTHPMNIKQESVV